MRLGGRIHRFWLAWHDWYVTIAGHEIALPSWPWRLYCRIVGHRVSDDQCGRPEHRYCWVCSASTPGAKVNAS